MSKKALLVIDVQNDFMPNGALPVEEGDQILPFINRIINGYDLVVATQDWHPANHYSFAKEHVGKKVFEVVDLFGTEQILWPVHCVQESDGAKLHKDLNTAPIAAIFRKGMDRCIDSYSAFYDNGEKKRTGLEAYLKSHGVEEVHVVGLAGDFCVYFTILDAMKAGFKVTLLEEGTRYIDKATWEEKKAGITRNPLFKLMPTDK